MEHNVESISLTTAEIGHLWSSYVLNSKSKYLLKHAVESIDDQEIKDVMKQSLHVTEKYLREIEVIFKGVNFPIPYGFKEDDVKIGAPKLYSDVLFLRIMKSLIIFGIGSYSLAISMAARHDVRKFFNQTMKDSIELLNKIDEIALQKGLFVRQPNIPIPETIEFAQSQSLMGAFLGHNRPLNALEAAYIFKSSLGCGVAQAVLTGLAQTGEQDRVRSFMAKGRRLLKEQIDSLNDFLTKESLTIPPSYEQEVSNTSEPIFSDKIALYFALSTITEVMYIYSSAKLVTLRKDIVLVLTQLQSELSMYAKDGMDILIDNGWFEEMPKNIDREDLIKSK